MTVTVSHAGGSYPVIVEAGLLSRLDGIVRERLPGARIAMIADARVFALLRDGRLGAPAWAGDALVFPSGESSKTREWWSRLTDGLLELGIGRDAGIVALGGGVAGDLAGFVAATYMRGLPCIQVPTTLLAMVDASVGGKTGVDTPHGKNLVGAFHPPVAVLADPLALRTLDEREFRSGLAEAVKHGLIADRDYFEWMERETDAIVRRDLAALTRLVTRSVEIKAAIVSEDEREGGRRAILNAGHTVAHALELATGFTLAHGEAVGLGLLAESELAARLSIGSPELRPRLAALLTRLGLPTRLPAPPAAQAVLAAMATDKKNRRARIRFSLPETLGTMHREGGWTAAAPESVILEALAML